MQRMQVPAGEEYAGLVFHKVQDDGWTGLPLPPAEDPQVRQVHRPSTAATLNFAAVAAKGSRLWAPVRRGVSPRAGRPSAQDGLGGRGRDAPTSTPPPSTATTVAARTTTRTSADEFSWAATGVDLTTDERGSADPRRSSPRRRPRCCGGVRPAAPRPPSAVMDLAPRAPTTTPDREGGHGASVGDAGRLSRSDQQRKALLRAAVPAVPTPRFEWGSERRSSLNNAVTLAAAADVTGDEEDTATAALESPGLRAGPQRARPVVRHRSTARSSRRTSTTGRLRPRAGPRRSRTPPTGTLSGGPNSSIQDPVAAQTWPQGCVAQRCYLDNIQSWSTNEMTVNWNSSLTWMAAWASSDGVVENGPTLSTGPPVRGALARGRRHRRRCAGRGVLLVRRRRSS